MAAEAMFVAACLLGFCIWPLAEAINSDCRCWENPVFRRSCRFGEWLNEESCRLAGCCYDAKTPSYQWPRPICYEKKGKCPTNEKCIVYGKRELCGHRAMGRTLCEQRGCCFDNSQYPFCYRPKDGTKQTSTKTTTTTTPMTTTTAPPITATTTTATPITATTTQTTTPTTTTTLPPTTASTSTVFVTTQTSTQATSTSSTPTTTSTSTLISTTTQATTPQLPEPSSPTTTTTSTTSSNPFTYLGGPFGFFQIGTMVIYSQCPPVGNASCLDGSITDQYNCTRSRCCWNGDLVGTTYDPCYRPSIHVINWPDPGKNITALPMWTPWTPWTQCSGQSCRVGIQTRERTCQDGVPGISCAGFASDARMCDSPCTTFWGPWTPWSDCSMECGPGFATRRRSCFNEDTNIVSNGECPMGSEGASEATPCQQEYCSSWSPWITGPCSSSCGRGLRNNTRICFSETLPQSPSSCYYVTAVCDDVPCAPQADVKPMWGPWTPWRRCSDPCGRGTRSRIRMCYDEASGEVVRTSSTLFCAQGQGFQIQNCNTGLCSSWSSWKPYSQLCSATCGITETRTCIGTSSAPSPFTCSRRTVPCNKSPCV